MHPKGSDGCSWSCPVDCCLWRKQGCGGSWWTYALAGTESDAFRGTIIIIPFKVNLSESFAGWKIQATKWYHESVLTMHQQRLKKGGPSVGVHIGYPEIISIGFSLINQPAMGVPPFMDPPKCWRLYGSPLVDYIHHFLVKMRFRPFWPFWWKLSCFVHQYPFQTDMMPW